MKNLEFKSPAESWFPTGLSSYDYSFSEEINTKVEESTQAKTVEVPEEEKHSTEKDESVNVKEVNELSKSELEQEVEPEVEEYEFELPDSTQLPDEVHELAPEELKPLLNFFKDENKDIVLLSCLTSLSSIFPNVSVIHRNDLYYPNLYLLVIGKAASGKGNILVGKKIIRDLLEELKTKNPDFHIAGNISSSKIIQRLAGSGESGNLIIETEADTISQNFKSEWGNFSSILRTSFHHEEANIDRVGLKEKLSQNPKLSLAIAGTPLQLIPLIGTPENGLYSRIMFYNIKKSGWMDDDENETYDAQEEEMARLNKLFLDLSSSVNSIPRRMKLSRVQKKFLNDNLKKAYEYLVEAGLESEDTVKRMGAILVRIFTIYTILETKDELTEDKSEFDCSENAFNFGLLLFPYLLKSSIESANVFQHSQRKPKTSLNDTQKQILEVLPASFISKEAVEIVTEKLRYSESTVNKTLKILKDKGLLKKEGLSYEKIKTTTS